MIFGMKLSQLEHGVMRLHPVFANGSLANSVATCQDDLSKNIWTFEDDFRSLSRKWLVVGPTFGSIFLSMRMLDVTNPLNTLEVMCSFVPSLSVNVVAQTSLYLVPRGGGADDGGNMPFLVADLS